MEEIDEGIEMARRARERAEEGARLVRRDLERLEATRRRSRLWPLVVMVMEFAVLIVVAWELFAWKW